MRAGSTFPSPHTIYQSEVRVADNPTGSARDADANPSDCERTNPPRMNLAIVSASTSNPHPIPVTALSHTEPDLFSSRLEQSTSALSINVEPTELRPGVYIGEGRAKSGEKFYLRMERVDDSNYPFWSSYLSATNKFCNSGKSLLGYLMNHIWVVDEIDGKKQFVYDNHRGVPDMVGMDAEEFQQLIDALGRGGYYKGGERKRRNALRQIDSGSKHLNINPSGSNYVIFASRCRELSTTDLASERDANAHKISLKDYFRQYRDILMCVGSQFSSDGKSFENRGIFRNPYSMIQKDYLGISMVLHVFTGAVVQKFFPERTKMVVRPVPSMQLIIFETLGRDDYTVAKQGDIDQLIRECREDCENREGIESHNDIKIEAIARLYATHASNSNVLRTIEADSDGQEENISCIVSSNCLSMRGGSFPKCWARRSLSTVLIWSSKIRPSLPA